MNNNYRKCVVDGRRKALFHQWSYESYQSPTSNVPSIRLMGIIEEMDGFVNAVLKEQIKFLDTDLYLKGETVSEENTETNRTKDVLDLARSICANDDGCLYCVRDPRTCGCVTRTECIDGHIQWLKRRL